MSRPPPATERVESRLKVLRAASGLSQGELAERVGLTRQAIYMIEAGRYLPNAATALRLARALACKVEDLFLIEDEAPRVEAELLSDSGDRVKLWKAGGRLRALSVSAMGDPFRGLLSADGSSSIEVAARDAVARSSLFRIPRCWSGRSRSPDATRRSSSSPIA